ncbi:hypothetical protein [Paludibacterium yongneupense]|uniref:hypothetical protein n=1 Tax=Paludibacterium yongneupense TaxID=400061 RepID=UPI000405602E|nr:hypothetical protein [Paludibacterium yongneupense]
MALEEYVGAIVLDVDGTEYEVVDLDVQTKTGRKLVKTMNSTGKAKGFSKGITEYSLSITVVIPLTGDIDWAAIEGAKVSITPEASGGSPVSYLNCCTTDVGEKYSVDNEGRRDIKMFATDKVNE